MDLDLYLSSAISHLWSALGKLGDLQFPNWWSRYNNTPKII